MQPTAMHSFMAPSVAADDFKMIPDDDLKSWRIMASAILGILGLAALYLGFWDLSQSGFAGDPTVKFWPYSADIYVMNLGAMAIAGALLVGRSEGSRPNKYVLVVFGLTLVIAGAIPLREAGIWIRDDGHVDVWSIGMAAIGLAPAVCSYRVSRRVFMAFRS